MCIVFVSIWSQFYLYCLIVNIYTAATDYKESNKALIELGNNDNIILGGVD